MKSNHLYKKAHMSRQLAPIAVADTTFKQNFLFDLEKLIEYWASAVNVVSTDPCVSPLPRIKISFHWLSTWRDELISTPKMMTFSPTLFLTTGSKVLANLTLLNKESFKVKSEFKCPMYLIYKQKT